MTSVTPGYFHKFSTVRKLIGKKLEEDTSSERQATRNMIFKICQRYSTIYVFVFPRRAVSFGTACAREKFQRCWNSGETCETRSCSDAL